MLAQAADPAKRTWHARLPGPKKAVSPGYVTVQATKPATKRRGGKPAEVRPGGSAFVTIDLSR